MLFENEEFMDKMPDVKTIDELGTLFSENGVEMDRDELKAFAEEGQKAFALDSADGELDEDSPENVSGGGRIISRFKKKLNSIVYIITKISQQSFSLCRLILSISNTIMSPHTNKYHFNTVFLLDTQRSFILVNHSIYLVVPGKLDLKMEVRHTDYFKIRYMNRI